MYLNYYYEVLILMILKVFLNMIIADLTFYIELNFIFTLIIDFNNIK